MPDPNARHPHNVPGAVFVDDSCVFCSFCIAVAPHHFAARDDQVLCTKQPLDPGEWEACRDAADGCPVDAIGLDGPHAE